MTFCLLKRSARYPATVTKIRYGSVKQTSPSDSAFASPITLPPRNTMNQRKTLSLIEPKNCANSTPMKLPELSPPWYGVRSDECDADGEDWLMAT